ncbi:MAG: hypothetical protein Q8K91_08950 [Hylemonella sp.]|nr:hypothetical protein [Hylemonella sp.]MDP1937317.1 hypothetical protein [Hylemonella sp.]
MKTACLLALCAVLQGCCSTPSHELYVERMNAKIGKTFQGLEPQFARVGNRESLIQTYETHYNKIDYRGIKVYAPRGTGSVSLDGREGLSDTADWCNVDVLLEVGTLKIVDWKYVKGSNPQKCTSQLVPCTGW